MSLMGGLVDTSTEHAAEAPKTAPIQEWMIRNAWGLVLGSGVLFWLVVVSAFALR